MRTFFICLICSLLSLTGLSQVNWDLTDSIVTRRLWVLPPPLIPGDIGSGTTNSIFMQQGIVDIQKEVEPYMVFHQMGITNLLQTNYFCEGIFSYCQKYNSDGFKFSKNLFVDGNMIASGYVIGATNVLNQTNIVWSTNAFYAPTNSQGTTLDMSIGYGDIYIDGLTSPLQFQAGDLLADSYQTACVFIRNLHAQPSIVTLQAKNVPFIRGTPYVTNVSVLTFFTHNWTNDVWTNAIVLPLW